MSRRYFFTEMVHSFYLQKNKIQSFSIRDERLLIANG